MVSKSQADRLSKTLLFVNAISTNISQCNVTQPA